MSLWDLNIAEWVAIGYEVGEWIRDNTGFDEWWYEWNGELDQAVFDWLDETFTPEPFGDFPEITDLDGYA